MARLKIRPIEVRYVDERRQFTLANFRGQTYAGEVAVLGALQAGDQPTTVVYVETGMPEKAPLFTQPGGSREELKNRVWVETIIQAAFWRDRADSSN